MRLWFDYVLIGLLALVAIGSAWAYNGLKEREKE